MNHAHTPTDHTGSNPDHAVPSHEAPSHEGAVDNQPADGDHGQGTNADGTNADGAHMHEQPTRADEHEPGRPAMTPEMKKAASEIFDPNATFESLGLRSSVLKGIHAMGFTKPTSIQARLIPALVNGHDVLGQAKTGTGKTAAFGLPLIHLCNKDEPFQGLVLAPTRELAIQISQEINELARFTPIRATTIYGGQAIRQQAKNLTKASQIIVGTPGRVMDMHERRMLDFSQTRFVVLDEVDRMLDIGFREDIRRILDLCPPIERRQTIMVSATISVEIEKLARRYMREPEKIVTSSGSLTVSLVEQHYLAVQPWDKRRLLLHLVKHEEPALTIVFCRLKRTVDELAKYLSDHGIGAHAMHGDMRQGKRNQVMEALKGGKLEVLIASDLASRGIDAEGVSHVINYDLPEDPDLYVHRIGRTARAGRGGVAWALVTPQQGELLTQIENLINAEIPKMEYPDFVASPKPERWRDVDAGGRPVVVVEPSDKAPKVSRMAAAAAKDVPAPEQVDTTKFPGGVVPTKLPPKRLFGKLPGRGR